MSRILYIDACAGASGDMLAGALLDLGLPLARLEELVGAMGLEGVRLSHERDMQGPLAASRLGVDFPEEQPHRHLKHVLEHINRLPAEVAEPAAAVFARLAESEARVHGSTPEQVHFHEVGAVDAMVDIMAFCAGLAWFGVDELVCSPLPLGRGFVDCAHGRLPLPAPAVLNLLGGRAPVREWPAEEETVTPTGAALISTLATGYGGMPSMSLERSGLGCGTRPGSVAPNVVRLLLGESYQAAEAAEIVEIVCNIDDMTPEDLAMAMRRVMEAGALDVAAIPTLMKKGRLGQTLVVMAEPAQAERLADLVLDLTSSLGARLRPCRRRCLPRTLEAFDTQWGRVGVKKARTASGWRVSLEADDIERISREHGLPPGEVRRQILKAYPG